MLCYLKPMLNPVRRRRRTLSMLFLCMGAGLLLWGALVLKGWLGGMPGKVYWFLCAYMAGMAVMSSLHELLASLSWMGQRSLELRVRRLALEVEALEAGQVAGQASTPLNWRVPQDTV